MSRQAQRSEATRGELLRVARQLFAERGYSATPIEEVAERAGVTKGALYHHFRDKRELFQAVFEELEQVMVGQVIEAAASEPDDVWRSLELGVEAFLRSGLDPAIQRIVFLEGPTVLGWEAWREIDDKYGYGLTKASLERAMDAGVMVRKPAEPLARLVLATLSEAACQIARADDTDIAMTEMSEAVWTMMESLRAR